MRRGLMVGLKISLKVAIAFGLACMVGILWPNAMRPVFTALAVSWLWLDWRAARLRARLASVDVS